MLPTPVWANGFSTMAPNHLIRKLNLEAPCLVGLYLWFIDAVAKHKDQPDEEVEYPVYKFSCDEHGAFENRVAEGIGCPTCEKESRVISTRFRGKVLWAQKEGISYTEIGDSVGKDWRLIQSQIKELVTLGYLERERDGGHDKYRFYVTDSFKHNDGLKAMQPTKVLTDAEKRLADKKAAEARIGTQCEFCHDTIPNINHRCMEAEEVGAAESEARDKVASKAESTVNTPAPTPPAKPPAPPAEVPVSLTEPVKVVTAPVIKAPEPSASIKAPAPTVPAPSNRALASEAPALIEELAKLPKYIFCKACGKEVDFPHVPCLTALRAEVAAKAVKQAERERLQPKAEVKPEVALARRFSALYYGDDADEMDETDLWDAERIWAAVFKKHIEGDSSRSFPALEGLLERAEDDEKFLRNIRDRNERDAAKYFIEHMAELEESELG